MSERVDTENPRIETERDRSIREMKSVDSHGEEEEDYEEQVENDGDEEEVPSDYEF